jgi:hypothetical protein
MLAAVETYVPQTGSFLSSPPERTSEGCLAALRGPRVERKPSMMLLRIALTSQKSKSGRTMNRKKSRIMESGRDAMLPPRNLAYCYFFFLVVVVSLALGFL